MPKKHTSRRRGSARERREHREARRGELLEAAHVAIRRHGAGASMEQVAAEAGVTKPILYRHVGGREALASALAERFVGELTARLEEVLGRPDVEPREMLTRALDAYFELIERETELYRFLVRRVGDEPGAAEVLAGVFGRIAEINVRVIGEEVREAGGDSGAAEPWGYGLVGMAHAVGDWWLERRTMPRERVVEYLVSMAWDGMRTAVTTGGTDAGREPGASEPGASG